MYNKNYIKGNISLQMCKEKCSLCKQYHPEFIFFNVFIILKWGICLVFKGFLLRCIYYVLSSQMYSNMSLTSIREYFSIFLTLERLYLKKLTMKYLNILSFKRNWRPNYFTIFSVLHIALFGPAWSLMQIRSKTYPNWPTTIFFFKILKYQHKSINTALLFNAVYLPKMLFSNGKVY